MSEVCMFLVGVIVGWLITGGPRVLVGAVTARRRLREAERELGKWDQA